MKITNKLNFKFKKKLFFSVASIFVIVVFLEIFFSKTAYSQTTCGWTKAGNQVCAEDPIKFEKMYKPELIRPGSIIVSGKPVASGAVCAQTKDGKYVCDKDLQALNKKYPMKNLDCNSIKVNGIPLKDAPGCPTAKQRLAEPSDYVRQTGSSGAKSASQIALEKKIAEENFKKQQEDAMLRNKTKPNQNCTMAREDNRKSPNYGKIVCKY